MTIERNCLSENVLNSFQGAVMAISNKWRRRGIGFLQMILRLRISISTELTYWRYQATMVSHHHLRGIGIFIYRGRSFDKYGSILRNEDSWNKSSRWLEKVATINGS